MRNTTVNKHVDLLLIELKDKTQYVLMKYFNTFMYDHVLLRGKRHFCCYYLLAFSPEEIWKSHVSDCFKINGKQIIQMLEESEYGKFKNNERKIKSPFMIYADFESISMPQDNGKQDPEESYMNKYKKHVPWSYGYKLVCVDDKFSKYFKSYLGGDAVFNFINNMIEESKYCTDNMKTLKQKAFNG